MNLNFCFESNNQLRYENGRLIAGTQDGVNRAVKVEPNIKGCEGYNIKGGHGYIVTVFNSDGNHPLLSSNIQMSPKPMKIVSQSSDKIILRGYPLQAMSPFGWVDFDGQDYGMSIFLKNGEVNKCILHMHDRYVDIEYLRDENSQVETYPSIVSFAQEANYQYKQENVTNARSLLIQIFRAVKSEPSLLKDVSDYSSIGKAFLFMIDTNLSDDLDTIQLMASISYLCISKAIEQDPDNINLFKDRIFLLRIAKEPLSYTVMSALDTDADPLNIFGSMSQFEAISAIYKMEIADLELHPQLYELVPFFKERKVEFDEMISDEFFMPDNSLAKIIKSGTEKHKKLLKYLENRVFNEKDIDF